MNLNRNSTEFNNNKQEFNVYKNVLRRLINRAKNIYYSTQFENNKGDGRKTWRTMDNLGLGQMPVPPIPNSARANAQSFPNSRTHLQKKYHAK